MFIKVQTPYFLLSHVLVSFLPPPPSSLSPFISGILLEVNEIIPYYFPSIFLLEVNHLIIFPSCSYFRLPTSSYHHFHHYLSFSRLVIIIILSFLMNSLDYEH